MSEPTDEQEVTAELAERLRHLRKSNTESMNTLGGRGAALDTHRVLRERTELLCDMLFGPIDFDHPEDTSIQRLTVEVEWAERLRSMLGIALVESTGTAAEIITPKTGLHLPPGTTRN